MALTKVGDDVLDLVIPYIHNLEDRNSVSLVSRKSYETDGITRKRLTVHTPYYPNPACLSKRFPFIQALIHRGLPFDFIVKNHYDFQITPWIQQIAHGFRSLKELHIRNLVVHDEDLETLARTRGKDLRTLKIKKCIRFSTDGLMHVSKYCNQLRTFCLEYYFDFKVKDGLWLHELALNNTFLERLHAKNINFYNNARCYEDLTRLAKNCCNSLISLKIGKCCLSRLVDAFRYAVRLEHFSGNNFDEESQLVGFQFPPNTRSLSRMELPVTQYLSVLPLLNQIRKLKLVFVDLDEYRQCLLFKRCPNLEVLYTDNVCGDRGLQVIGQFCKKLRKLTHNGLVTHVGLIALAKGCTNLECLKVRLGDIPNEAIKCLVTHLKNLCKFRMYLVRKQGTTDLPLDNWIQAMLMGCSKLERLNIWHGALTDVGLEYIGKYGTNLRSLTLAFTGESNVGLAKISEGCPKLRKLKLNGCPFSKQAIASSVFKIPSLRCVSGHNTDFTPFALTRPDIQL